MWDLKSGILSGSTILPCAASDGWVRTCNVLRPVTYKL